MPAAGAAVIDKVSSCLPPLRPPPRSRRQRRAPSPAGGGDTLVQGGGGRGGDSAPLCANDGRVSAPAPAPRPRRARARARSGGRGGDSAPLCANDRRVLRARARARTRARTRARARARAGGADREGLVATVKGGGAAEAAALDETTSIGYTILRAMGWVEGQGLDATRAASSSRSPSPRGGCWRSWARLRRPARG